MITTGWQKLSSRHHEHAAKQRVEAYDHLQRAGLRPMDDSETKGALRWKVLIKRYCGETVKAPLQHSISPCLARAGSLERPLISTASSHGAIGPLSYAAPPHMQKKCRLDGSQGPPEVT